MFATGSRSLARETFLDVRPELTAEAEGFLYFEDIPSPERYENGRGWAIYSQGTIRSFALSPDAWKSVVLWVDVDDPGDEGARVRVFWDGACGARGGVPEEVRVDRSTSIAFPPCEGVEDRRLVVQFLNDDSHDGFDRNVYITLRQPSFSPP